MDYRMIALSQFCLDAKKTKERVSIRSALEGADKIDLPVRADLKAVEGKTMSKDIRGYTNGPWPKMNVDLSNKKLHQVIGPVVCKNEVSVEDANLIAECAPLLEALEEMLDDYKDAAIDFDPHNREAADEIIARAEGVISRALGKKDDESISCL